MSIFKAPLQKRISNLASLKGPDVQPYSKDKMIKLFNLFRSEGFRIFKQGDVSVNFHRSTTSELYCLPVLTLVNNLASFFLPVSRLDHATQKELFIQSKESYQDQSNFSEDMYVFTLQLHQLFMKEALAMLLAVEDIDLLIESNMIYSYLARFTQPNDGIWYQYILGPSFASGGTAIVHYAIYQDQNQLPVVAAFKKPKSPSNRANFILEGNSFHLTNSIDHPCVLKAFEVEEDFILMETGFEAMNLNEALCYESLQTCLDSLLSAIDLLPLIWMQGYFYGDFKLDNIIIFYDACKNFQTKVIDLTLNPFSRINNHNFGRTPGYFFEFPEVCDEIKRLKSQEYEYSEIEAKIAISHDIKAISFIVYNILYHLHSTHILNSETVQTLLAKSNSLEHTTALIVSSDDFHSEIFDELKTTIENLKTQL